MIRLLFVGDIMGSAGRKALAGSLETLVDSERVDFVVANAENAAGGFGITTGVLEELERYPVDVGITALAEIEGWLVLGYSEGAIELVPIGEGDREESFSFEDVPSGPVEQILPGPMDTIVAGYAGGQLGIWSLDSGARLVHLRLHGPVTELRLQDHTLHVATELGDTEELDLDVLYRDYCAVLGEVWDDVPVVWESGRPVLRPPPPDHRCR